MQWRFAIYGMITGAAIPAIAAGATLLERAGGQRASYLLMYVWMIIAGVPINLYHFLRHRKLAPHEHMTFTKAFCICLVAYLIFGGLVGWLAGFIFRLRKNQGRF